ncbi:lipase member N-like isoform X1 [Diabrotica undecimpunctata]|uniref:lipase member N-like isoform X1 n=1 Tax=Diabrotica undecimpunctata TaxID=50387 RepID=UPI003B6408CF
MLLSVFLLCLFYTSATEAFFSRNNVCTDFRAYGNIHKSKKCSYNPDLNSAPSEIATRHGFNLEEHRVTTQDGYILTIFRMRPRNKDVKSSQDPIILQHGIFVDGRSWFISGNSSLAFKLVDNGYDLWIPNFRGTTYSKKHVNKNISQKEYWNYSVHEIGIYDVAAIVEYVANFTERKDISYIGHSMGTSAFTIYATERPEHARKYIKQIIFLAPVVNFSHPPVALKIVLPYTYVIKEMFDSLKVYAIGNLSEVQRLFTTAFCRNYPLIVGCQIAMSMVSGIVMEQVRPEVVPLIVKLFPVAISVKSLVHFAQISLNNGTFQQYDYGDELNMKKYNSKTPPKYDIDKLKIPITIFAGSHDILSEIQDVHRFYDSLKSPKDLHTYELSHLDYMYGKDVIDVYNDILQVLKKDFK